jgi:hypothetical protein
MTHWQAEARRFRGDPADRFAPSMRQRIDFARLLPAGAAAGSRDDRRSAADADVGGLHRDPSGHAARPARDPGLG